MTVKNTYNLVAKGKRQLILDLETTGLFPAEGEKIIDVGIIEMVDGQQTGKKLHLYVNPGKKMEPSNIAIHHITNEMLHDKPHFNDVAKEIRDFIGNDQVVITCQTYDDVTLDIEFLNTELAAAGQPEIPADQWLNVRRWSEAMFTDEFSPLFIDKKKGAKLDSIALRYGLSLEEREKNGHGALLDAQLLANVYPKLLNEYTAFSAKKNVTAKKPAPSKP